MSIPDGPRVVPAAVERLAEGRPVRPVWHNEVGGLTFEIGDDADRCFVKWAPTGSGLPLRPEVPRLAWAGQFTPVPGVIEHGADPAGEWLVLTPMEGETAVSDRWRADPATAVRAIGEGLRALHDKLPVPDCPFSWSAEERLGRAHRLAEAGQIDPGQWHKSHQHLDLRTAFARASDVPPTDKLVVCHGDACAPNTLIGHDGRWTGHVDMGALGVADRWADLAVAAWSTEWNYGPGWEGPLLDAYGTAPDPERSAYYRLLWDLA
jgi:aminoglycoside phosphotransferase